LKAKGGRLRFFSKESAYLKVEVWQEYQSQLGSVAKEVQHIHLNQDGCVLKLSSQKVYELRNGLARHLEAVAIKRFLADVDRQNKVETCFHATAKQYLAIQLDHAQNEDLEAVIREHEEITADIAFKARMRILAEDENQTFKGCLQVFCYKRFHTVAGVLLGAFGLYLVWSIIQLYLAGHSCVNDYCSGQQSVTQCGLRSLSSCCGVLGLPACSAQFCCDKTDCAKFSCPAGHHNKRRRKGVGQVIMLSGIVLLIVRAGQGHYDTKATIYGCELSFGAYE